MGDDVCISEADKIGLWRWSRHFSVGTDSSQVIQRLKVLKVFLDLVFFKPSPG